MGCDQVSAWALSCALSALPVTATTKTKPQAVKPKDLPWDQREHPLFPHPHSLWAPTLFSALPSGAWVSKSLRIRRPQPCCRPGDPQGCPCCLAPQTVLPHPGAAPCDFSTTQHLPSDWCGVSMVTSCVLPPCALWRSRHRTPPTYNWCYQLGQTQLKHTPSCDPQRPTKEPQITQGLFIYSAAVTDQARLTTLSSDLPSSRHPIRLKQTY